MYVRTVRMYVLKNGQPSKKRTAVQYRTKIITSINVVNPYEIESIIAS